MLRRLLQQKPVSMLLVLVARTSGGIRDASEEAVAENLETDELVNLSVGAREVQ